MLSYTAFRAETIAVSKTDPNENLDADILQCKADILHSRNIIPLHKEKTISRPAAKKDTTSKIEPKTTENSEKKTPSSQDGKKLTLEDIIPLSAETGTKPVRNEVPRFDLAEEIMAEHRKVIATKRKSPGQKSDTQIEAGTQQVIEPQPVSRPVIPKPDTVLLIPDQIIAEIVARDIERLCWGNTADI
jgi:hypothetical protein